MTASTANRQKQSGFTLNPICFLLLMIAVVALPLFPVFQPETLYDFSGWKFSDLLWIDRGDASLPENSLIAVYFRQQPLLTQIRLDFLEMNRFDANNIFVALDLRPGGLEQLPSGQPSPIKWEFLISIPAGEMPQVLQADNCVSTPFHPRVVSDPTLETMVISWNRDSLKALSTTLKFQVSVAPVNVVEIVSQSPPLHPGMPLPAAAPLLLEFWNTLPASTPAQALRRWDGAHTGPIGQRHGLNTLLSRASEYQIPLALLDLRQPESLAVLEYMSHSDSVLSKVISRQVITPNLTWGDSRLNELSSAISQRESMKLGWSQSLFNFGPISKDKIKPLEMYFAETSDRHHILEWRGSRFIPLPVPLYQPNQESLRDEISATGLSLSIKQELLAAALSPDPSDLVVLGGNLNQSLWGEDSIAPLAFQYITTHPWILPLNSTQLSAFPALSTTSDPFSDCEDILCTPKSADFALNTIHGEPFPSGITLRQLQDTYQEALVSLPDNIYTQFAIKTYLHLTTTTSNPDLANLKANYLSQLGYLIYTAQWAQNPSPQLSTNLDVDWDGLPEVVLASDKYIAIIELDDGGIVLAGSRFDQWIAPSSQFAVGLGSPETWKLGSGSFSDPQVIQGALSDLDLPNLPYEVEFQTDTVILTDPISLLRKTVRLIPAGFSITIENSPNNQVSFPLILPTSSNSPSTWVSTVQPTCLAQSCTVPTSSGSLSIQSNASTISMITCLDSASFMQSPEIPDRSYPAGHFLPFPLAKIDFSGAFSLNIVLIELAKTID